MSNASSAEGAPEHDRRGAVSVKIVVAGGFAVGKTTFVGSISEIEPVRTEEAMTAVGAGVDDRGDLSAKTATTVTMDFGRITLDDQMVLYLFGTPGQERFSFLWDDLTAGAIGAVVLVDTQRLDACFPAVDYFEQRDIPFIVAVNRFHGQALHGLDEVREAMALGDGVPMTYCDARERDSTKQVLAELLRAAIGRLERRATAGVP